MKKLKLTINVTYEPHGVTQGELMDILLGAASHLAGEGLFTLDTPAEVETWDSRVDVVKK